MIHSNVKEEPEKTGIKLQKQGNLLANLQSFCLPTETHRTQ